MFIANAPGTEPYDPIKIFVPSELRYCGVWMASERVAVMECSKNVNDPGLRVFVRCDGFGTLSSS